MGRSQGVDFISCGTEIMTGVEGVHSITIVSSCARATPVEEGPQIVNEACSHYLALTNR